MTYLSWDESRPCVLDMRRRVFAEREPGHAREARPLDTAMENTE